MVQSGLGNEDTRAAEDDARSTLDELEGRRVKVITLRLRGYTQGAMARALGVDQSTISRDMAWIRNHRDELFGDHATFDSAQEIGEAVARFAEVEMAALRDYDRTIEMKDRSAFLRTVLMARQKRVDLLLDLGFLDRPIGNIGVAFRADVVRQAYWTKGYCCPMAARPTPRSRQRRTRTKARPILPLQSAKQFGGCHVQPVREPADDIETRRSLAALDPTHVRPVQARALG